jgi:hypothetical protein
MMVSLLGDYLPTLQQKLWMVEDLYLRIIEDRLLTTFTTIFVSWQ